MSIPIPDAYVHKTTLITTPDGVEYVRVTADVVYKFANGSDPEPYCQADRWLTSEAAQIRQLTLALEKLKAELRQHQVQRSKTVTVNEANLVCPICGKTGFAIKSSFAKQRAALKAHIRFAHKNM